MSYLANVYGVVKNDEKKDEKSENPLKLEETGKRNKGDKTPVELLHKVEATYTTELVQIAQKCVRGMETLRTYGTKASWQELRKEHKDVLDFKYWTMSEGKLVQKSVDAEYLTRLAMSLYTLMEKTSDKKELELHRVIRSATRNFRLFSRYVGVMKSNDAFNKAERTQLDKLDESKEYGIEFGVKAEVAAAA